MNKKYEQFAAISKIEAFKQYKERQRGVLTAQGGFSTTDPALLHVPCTIQCVFVPQTFESRQCVFDTRGSNASPRIDILENGRMSIYYSGTNKTIDISIGTLYNITFVTTETEQSVYVGGELLGSAPYSTPQFAYYVIGALTGRFMYRFKGDYLLHRHFNYAMSADEVKALDNNGDPMGYVVPKAMRELLSVNLIGSNSFTWDGSDSPYYYNITGNPITIGKYYKINVTVSDYQLGSPRIFAGISYPIPAQNGTFDIVVYNERYVNNFPIYGGSDGDPNRHLTITVNSITSVGLLAEYLPQNLVGQWHEKPFEITGITTYTWTGETDPVYYQELLLGRFIQTGAVVMIKGSVSDYQSGEPFVYVGNRQAMIPAQNGSFTLKVINNRDNIDRIYYYGGTVRSDRRLTITIDSVELIPDVALSWLDSAKQFPLNDEYLPPLLQSDGGYDLVANGAPKVLFNE